MLPLKQFNYSRDDCCENDNNKANQIIIVNLSNRTHNIVRLHRKIKKKTIHRKNKNSLRV